MTAARVYLVLLRLYPRSLRREYGPEMLEIFLAVRRDGRQRGVRFWRFVLLDVGRSAFAAHRDAWRSDGRRFTLEWVAACAAGAAATSLFAHSLTSAFRYLYHPYLEGVLVPPWAYGALLGIALGSAQTVVFRRRLRLGIPWILTSGLGAAVGLEAAQAVSSLTGPVFFGVTLGAIVGGVHWLVLRARVQRAALWGLASTVALSVAILTCAMSVHTALSGMNALVASSTRVTEEGPSPLTVQRLFAPADPPDWMGEAATMAMCGLVIALLTANVLSPNHAHQNRT